MVIVEISAESVKACSFHQRKSIPDTEINYSVLPTIWKQRHTCRTQWNTCLMKTNDVASVVLFVNWLECFREIWAGLETKETLLLVPAYQNLGEQLHNLYEEKN
jgi:hypothetical protein